MIPIPESKTGWETEVGTSRDTNSDDMQFFGTGVSGPEQVP